MNEYTEGDLVHCIGVFSDPVTHELVNPDDVTARLKDPTGTITTPDLYPEGTHYAFDADTTGIVAGVWYYRFSSPASKQGAKENCFTVEPSNFS